MNRQSKGSAPPRSYLGMAVDYLAPLLKFSSVGMFIFVVILTASLFAYIAFYQAVVPDIEFSMPINFRYKTDCYLNGETHSEAQHCTFPLGNVSLFRPSGLQLLAPGQEYVFSVKLEVPESEVNYQIGNFLVSVDVFGDGNSKQYGETENVLLAYRSMLFTVLRTVFLFPLLLFGYVDQRQTLNIVFEKSFTESLFAPSQYLLIQLHSRYLQFYTANLRISAQLRGIKYALFAYPLMSGAIIVAILMGLFGMIVVVSLCQRLYSSMSVPPPSNRGANGLLLSDPSSTASSTPRSTSPTSPSSFSPTRPLAYRASSMASDSGSQTPGERIRSDNSLRFRTASSTARANESAAAVDDWQPASTTSDLSQ